MTPSATDPKVDAIRTKNRAGLPAGYHGIAHLGLNAMVVLTAIGFAIVKLDRFDWMKAVALVGFFAAWALVEYSFHRTVLHRFRPGTRRLYAEHSKQHHGYFTTQHMNIESHVDLNRVFLRPLDILLFEVIAGMLSGAVALALHPMLGLLIFLSGNVYCLAYEVFHGLYHWPLAFQVPLIASRARHHRAHHDQELMARGNFALVFPVLDRWFGSSLDNDGDSL
jgi:sterol desaturase/sphingolipid hydroxylase (fatty acid hydroxylase superfamily)